MTDPAILDVIVVGAGPAGLTAALYLSRYRRSVLVLHDGQSRALRIPKTYNAPGYPNGISGPELITRMTEHAETYGANIIQTKVSHAERLGKGFLLSGEREQSWRSRVLILAAGVHLNQIDLPPETHEAAIAAGVLRYCPVCDGYEHIDKKICVVGCDSNGAAEALFLRQYSQDITLMPLDNLELTKEQIAELNDASITVVRGRLKSVTPVEDRIDVLLDFEGTSRSFDVLYPALGTRPRSKLATSLGARVNRQGCLPADAIEITEVPGFFAAGDVVEGLSQISVAIGDGTLAATNAHNWLRECDRHSLQAR